MVKFMGKFEKVGVVSEFIKKIQGLSCDFDIFWDFSKLFLYRKSHGSGLWITRPRLPLSSWWTRDHGVARLLQGSRGRCDSSEREREREKRSSGFSPMTPLRGGAAEMVIQRCSTETVSGALMERWFRTWGEIGVRVGTVDNGGALVAPFIRT
jgi:hypothetical protein